MPKIISGEFRSRSLLNIPDDLSTRPFLGRVKESVFGMLYEWFEGANVLDLFAGIGTVGLEAVSRGASSVLMVEKNPKVFAVLQQNIEMFNCSDRAIAMQADALAQTCLLRAPQPIDLIFMDPPYRMMQDELGRARILNQLHLCRTLMGDKGFVVLRSPVNPNDVDFSIPGFEGPEIHQYQKSMWTFLYSPATDQSSTTKDGDESARE